MKRTVIVTGTALVVIGAIDYGMLASGRSAATSVSSPAAHEGQDMHAAVVAAAPGRVEAVSEEIRVASQIGGRLQQVLVEEGDAVTRGQVLAVVENADYRARVASAEAMLRLREADARRVHNGAREEERRDAEAAVREASAVLDNANADVARKRDLLKQAVISQSEWDKAEEQLGVARARVDSARERLSLVQAGAREEDRAHADAEVALARAALDEARAVLEKTYVRSPIDGIVFRKFRRAGESVSTQFDAPIVTLADRSRTRVRVDIDETDIARLRAGQRAYVTADAFGDRRFSGRVVRVGQMLGKKNVRTDEPTERVDTKILETLVELEDGRELPLGLRVQAFIVGR
jgi:HlyD family secretion protein